MYEAFYGLSEKPFNLTPDPKYLYLSEKHKEAFAHLLFGIKNRSGFVMVTGEIGTGKTTICRNLLNQLDPNTDLAFIYNPALNPVELIKKINAEFGINSDADNVLDLAEDLNAYLLNATAEGKNCVLVIDEAQNLAPAVLEQIRLLSNLETEKEKLLQIILIGQPELGEKLALHELRQLNQRITARYHLSALNEQETRQYIAYRIHIAGGRKSLRFTRQAFKMVYKRSAGTPRVINAICDRALLIGYTSETHTITSAIVKRAAKEVRGGKVSKRAVLQRSSSWMPSPSAIVGGLLILGASLILAQAGNNFAREIGNFNQLMVGDADIESQLADSALPKVDARAEEPPKASDAAASVQNSLPMKALKKVVEQQTPPEPEAFGDVLAELNTEGARRAASAALIRAWDSELNGAYPSGDAVESLQDFAEAHALAHEYLSPALDQLLAVNLPAFVRVQVEDKPLWLGLLGAEDDELELTLEPGEKTTVRRDEFLKYYQDEALVLWRDPAPNAPALLPGRSGQNVAQLKAQLRGIGRLAENNTNASYDQETGRAISRLQAETGLLVDGMAGRQVRMVLTSWAGGPRTPNLRELAEGERVQRARVEAPPAKRAAKPKPKPKPAPKAAAPPAESKPQQPPKRSLTNPRPSAQTSAADETPKKPEPVAAETEPLETPAPAKPAPVAADTASADEAAEAQEQTTKVAEAPAASAQSEDADADTVDDETNESADDAPEADAQVAETDDDGAAVEVEELPEPFAPDGSAALALPKQEDSVTAPAVGSSPLVPGDAG